MGERESGGAGTELFPVPQSPSHPVSHSPLPRLSLAPDRADRRGRGVLPSVADWQHPARPVRRRSDRRPGCARRAGRPRRDLLPRQFRPRGAAHVARGRHVPTHGRDAAGSTAAIGVRGDRDRARDVLVGARVGCGDGRRTTDDGRPIRPSSFVLRPAHRRPLHRHLLLARPLLALRHPRRFHTTVRRARVRSVLARGSNVSNVLTFKR